MVLGFLQQMYAVLVGDFTIMPRRDIIRAQLLCFLQEGAELNFTVAKNVGVRGAPCLVFRKEIGKDPIHVFLGEIDGVIGDVEYGANAPYVGVILFGGTASVFIILFPVEHKQPDDVVTLLF